MSPRLSKMLMAAALAVTTFAGAAIAQPSGGPGPNSASQGPIPTDSVPPGAIQGTLPNDGRIVLQPQQSAAPMPMMTTQRAMSRRAARRHRRAMRRAAGANAVTTAPADAGSGTK